MPETPAPQRCANCAYWREGRPYVRCTVLRVRPTWGELKHMPTAPDDGAFCHRHKPKKEPRP